MNARANCACGAVCRELSDLCPFRVEVWNAAIDSAVRAAEMHAGDAAHFGADAEARGAQNAAEVIKGLFKKGTTC